MIAFRYDKTFEGLLCVLFEAYGGRAFPDALIGPGEAAPMFATEVRDIATDQARAARVWAGLERRLARQIRNMLMHVWLSEEKGGDLLLVRYMRKVFDHGGGVATDFADPVILEAHKLAQRVSKERLRVMQFARFQKAADGTYVAPVTPRHNVLPLTLGHFTDRFAGQPWLVYDLRRGYGYLHDMKTVAEISLPDGIGLPGGRLDPALIADDEELFQRLWRSYFGAMAIKERLNPRLHRQHMPARFWKYMPEKF